MMPLALELKISLLLRRPKQSTNSVIDRRSSKRPHTSVDLDGLTWVFRYFGFEHLTMVPMCKKLTDLSRLTLDEKEWLNAYHKEVYEKAKPFIKDSWAMEWLERETASIADLRV